MQLKNVPPVEIKKFEVPSKSRPGLMHEVHLAHDGSLFCTCEAGAFNRPCSHKKKVRAQLYKANQKLF